MQISPQLMPKAFVNNTKFNSFDKNYTTQNAISNFDLPAISKNYFLSFKGGYSLDLAQTMQNFEEFEALEDRKIVPELVRTEAERVLSLGNPDKETLIDSHKRVYEQLKYAETLDEAKALYPEFSDVVSANEVEARPGSFLDNIKAGKSEWFSKDEDFALQLLKLYWADGFSLSDLSKYTNDNMSFGHIMSKLNIPRLDKHYAHILKFSDKEYNERMTEEMTIKRIETLEKQTGYVHIPRGPMSEEQKKKISEALIEFYIKHPERASLLSIRQKEYYQNNPEQVEIFKRVIQDAWKLGSSRPVKDALVSFFRQKQAKPLTDEQLADAMNMGVKNRLLLQEFWDKNPKAKDKFGTSLKCAWKRVREVIDVEKSIVFYPYPLYPRKLANNLKEYAKQKGYKENDLYLTLNSYTGKANRYSQTTSVKIISEYLATHRKEAMDYANTLVLTIGTIYHLFLKLEKKSDVDNKIIDLIKTKTNACKDDTNLIFLTDLYIDILGTIMTESPKHPILNIIKNGGLDNVYDEIISGKSRGLEAPTFDLIRAIEYRTGRK